MTSRTWVDGSTPALSAANLNSLEADLDRALGNTYATKTANYSMTTADRIIFVNGSGITITLPDPTAVAVNSAYVVKNVTNNTNNLLASAGSGSQKIDTQAVNSPFTVKMGPYQSVWLASDGTSWWTIGTGLQLGSFELGIDSSGTLRFASNNSGKALAIGSVGADKFSVDASGYISMIDGQGSVIGISTGSQPTDNANYGLRIGWAGSTPARLWHKTWGFNSTSGWAPVTASRSYATKTASYTLTSSDEFVIFNGTSLTATLPDPTSTAMNGRVFSVKNINSSALSVVSAGTSKTIDGAASVTVNQWGGLDLISDGTQWLIRSKI